jgi:hypothetical protein
MLLVLAKGLRNDRRIARTGVQLGSTAGEQFSPEGHADAAVGAGYKGDCIVYVHKSLLRGLFRM